MDHKLVQLRNHSLVQQLRNHSLELNHNNHDRTNQRLHSTERKQQLQPTKREYELTFRRLQKLELTWVEFRQQFGPKKRSRQPLVLNKVGLIVDGLA